MRLPAPFGEYWKSGGSSTTAGSAGGAPAAGPCLRALPALAEATGCAADAEGSGDALATDAAADGAPSVDAAAVGGGGTVTAGAGGSGGGSGGALAEGSVAGVRSHSGP